MKLRILLVAPAILLAGSAASAQTLEDEVQILLDTNPQVQAARANLAATQEGVTKAFADFLPKLNFTGHYGYDNIDSPGRRAAEPDGTKISAMPRKVGFTVTQTVFNGYANYANNETARLSRDIAQIALEGNSQGITFEGTSTYLQVLRDMRLLELSSSSEANIQLQLELEDERVRRGSGITVDVLQAKSRLQIAKERRVALNGALEDSRSRYEQVFGTLPDTATMVMPSPPLERLPTALDEAIAIALAEHPSVANSAKLVDLANTRRDSSEAPYYPNIDFITEWAFEDDFNGSLGTRRDAKVSFQINWELFSGFATQAGVSEAAELYRASMDEEAFVKRKVIEEVRISWQGLQTARERVMLLQNAVNIAREVFDSRRKLREAGQETVINVLDAEGEVFNARINFVSAQHDARVAVYRMLLAIGRLVPANLTLAGP